MPPFDAHLCQQVRLALPVDAVHLADSFQRTLQEGKGSGHEKGCRRLRLGEQGQHRPSQHAQERRADARTLADVSNSFSFSGATKPCDICVKLSKS